MSFAKGKKVVIHVHWMSLILENSYVWSGNVPNDIDSELDYLE